MIVALPYASFVIVCELGRLIDSQAVPSSALLVDQVLFTIVPGERKMVIVVDGIVGI